MGGIADLVVLNTTGSEFWGFPRDEYTTLADAHDRMLATTVSAQWRLREPAAAFPTAAHPLAIPGSRPMRLRSPDALIRDLWDAIADVIARSPAAPRTTSSQAFAAAEPTQVSDLAEWLADTSDGLSAGARLGLRIEAVATPPVAEDDPDGDPAEGPGGAKRDRRAPRRS